jgi:hypothetical protein
MEQEVGGGRRQQPTSAAGSTVHPTDRRRLAVRRNAREERSCAWTETARSTEWALVLLTFLVMVKKRGRNRFSVLSAKKAHQMQTAISPIAIRIGFVSKKEEKTISLQRPRPATLLVCHRAWPGPLALRLPRDGVLSLKLTMSSPKPTKERGSSMVGRVRGGGLIGVVVVEAPIELEFWGDSDGGILVSFSEVQRWSRGARRTGSGRRGCRHSHGQTTGGGWVRGAGVQKST